MEFIKFILLGIGVFAFSNSFSQRNEVDEQGRRQGAWAKTYENSRVYRYKGQFKDDKPVGTFTYFYTNKNVKAVIKHDSTSNRSEGYFYHKNKNIMSYGIYRDMKKDSVWLNFVPSGRLSTSETYKMDSLHGEKIIYFVPEDPNDKRRFVMGKYNYENGKMHGDFIEYFNNGQIKRTGKYKNGLKSGMWTWYEPTGDKRRVTEYQKGYKHGWELGYLDGKIKVKSYYHFNRLVEGEEREKLFKQFEELGIEP